MNVKVAAIGMCNEKSWVDDKLTYFYARPGMPPQEVRGIADWYIDLAVELLTVAAANGAKIACLPEHAVDIRLWLAQTPEPQRRQVSIYAWNKQLDVLAALARKLDMVIVGGCAEPDEQDDCYYNSAPIFDRDGSFLGAYRKVQLTEGETRWLRRGRSLPVFPTDYGRIGALICWDIMFPEITQTLAVQGAQLLLHPTYGHSGHQADFMAATRAYDAACPLVVAMWNGAACVFDKDGRKLAFASRTRDYRGLIPHQIVYAEVDPTTPRRWNDDCPDYRQMIQRERQIAAYQPLYADAEQARTS